jgi:hypothetical protein
MAASLCVWEGTWHTKEATRRRTWGRHNGSRQHVTISPKQQQLSGDISWDVVGPLLQDKDGRAVSREEDLSLGKETPYPFETT